MDNTEDKAQIGLIGLAVMGENLARNIADKKFKTVVFNRTSEKTVDFVKNFGSAYLSGENELEDFVKKIEKPRKIILMVKAGAAVDVMISSLIPLLDEGDIIMDLGNSNYRDSQRRQIILKEKKLLFIGCGISGGEEGALKGPSLMPGCDKSAYDQVSEVLTAIAAKDFKGNSCVTYIGKNGAGHYVKMVHNGIEYGIMQLMAEAYDILRKKYKLKANEIGEIFEKFNEGKLNSYLLEISARVLAKKDDNSDEYLVDKILDRAAQKGTGKWTAIDGLQRGISVSCISEAVFSRYNSSEIDLRKKISESLNMSVIESDVFSDENIEKLEQALYAAIICCYAQGFALIEAAAKEENWDINLSEIARIWQGGCIIRAKILEELTEAYEEKAMNHLFEIPKIADSLKGAIGALRNVCIRANEIGVAIPVFSSALAYFDGM
ncbi:NADP-dependent phosphogluconate dehydrogenase, partial [Patescibacteria group bacterium]|nr:NADP-dependent phosphogluconate dehydrogenase [Patescibacteria group bacterium]